ncbi:hypothetical protein DFH08DRAFT_962050 [Mycena albidolilacea]|uniref:Uncharacterized protein n=1 Tax=Mycena albidolilacea TaxID=1033008 RepID=A0AAD6ZY33_9AGAR|nr:hypothetical protein DFH08DRAFT_962050 [Mycena albidolilacea]
MFLLEPCRWNHWQWQLFLHDIDCDATVDVLKLLTAGTATATSIHSWAAPGKYHSNCSSSVLKMTIVVSDSEADAGANNLEGHCKPFHCRTIYRVIQQSKFFPGDSVRNLLLTWEPTQEVIPKAILTACHSIENLWLSTTAPTTLFHLLEDQPLKQLYCNV